VGVVGEVLFRGLERPSEPQVYLYKQLPDQTAIFYSPRELVIRRSDGCYSTEINMARELKTLVEGGRFFEGPRWYGGNWWVSDFYRHSVDRVSPDGAAETVLEVEQQPSGLGWLPDGSMLVVSMKDRRVLRRSPQGNVSMHADLWVANLASGVNS